MYEELIHDLRLHHDTVVETYSQDGMEITETVYSQAADAIEELQEDSVPIGDMKMILEEVAKPRWIPVTEGLPKTRESILGKKSSKVIVAFRFDDWTQGTDTAHTLNGEWVFEDHITVVARTITHWMPLPKPPKEE